MEGFVNFAISDDASAGGVREELLAQRTRLSSFLREQMTSIIEAWIEEAEEEETPDGLHKGNLNTLVVLHAHIVLLFGNLQPDEMTANNLGQLIGSLAYVRTEHGYGTIMRNLDLNDDSGDRSAEMDGLREIAEAVADAPGAEVDAAARQAAQARLNELTIESDGQSGMFSVRCGQNSLSLPNGNASRAGLLRAIVLTRLTLFRMTKNGSRRWRSRPS